MPALNPRYFVSRAGIAIGTPVLATAIGIDVITKGNIRTVILADNRLGLIGQILRSHGSEGIDKLLVVLQVLKVIIYPDAFKAIRRRGRGTTPFQGGSVFQWFQTPLEGNPRFMTFSQFASHGEEF